MKKIKVLSVQFDVCTKDEALARILDVLKNRSHESAKQIVTPNPEMLLHAQRDSSFRETLNRSWMSIPDGIGILWASTFQEITKRSDSIGRLFKGLISLMGLAFFPRSCQRVFQERITGVDLMESVCAVSRDGKIPIFLLGAQAGIAEKVKEILEIRYPGVNIVGTFSGSPNNFDFPAIHALISETRPEILFVAYGAPAQELWISHHLSKFPSVKIAMGVGGAFDFLSGLKKRAPKWMQKLGLEWLYRLLKEPSRIKRIWNAAIKFPFRVILS